MSFNLPSSKYANASAEVDHEFVAELISACNGPISGCTDADALNFNEEAVIDDNSCNYCPCNYYANPLYDENSDCEEQCLPIEEEEEEEKEEEENSSSNENTCTLCDVVQAANGQVNINIKSGGEVSYNTENTNISNNDESSQGDDENKKKGNNKKSKNKNDKKSSDDNNQKILKKIDQLEEKLEKSEKKDSKKGVESKRTQLLRKTIELLEARL
jgi:hypothetical protein